MTFRKPASFKSPAQLREYAAGLGVELPVADALQSGPESPLGRSLKVGDITVGNRFAILPMEGWDGTEDGKPTDLTRRRWERFGASGAKLIWGGEAVAVRHDGRANPNQLLMTEANLGAIAELRELLVRTHAERFGRTDDLFVGLQLTHSGRFARPNDKRTPEPRIAHRHPILDGKVNANHENLLTDDDLSRLIDDFVAAAKMAERAGFGFVDVKHCHGYLGHELLGAKTRPGRYGSSLDNRMRFLREVVAGIRTEAPSLAVGVRLSIFDSVPFAARADGVGVPQAMDAPRQFHFGCDESGQRVDLYEPIAYLQAVAGLGVNWICTTAGSPYYNPHLQRPAAFPPSDGYLPPEDPLVGVARQIAATAELKRAVPALTFVGSGYTYMQDWLPHVGQAAVEQGMVDFVGLGRMVLSYPELPADVLAGRPLDRKRICRTFSECTTAPRNGLISGCFPLDPFYKSRPEAERLAEIVHGK